MPEETLTRKITGMLRSGSRRPNVEGGYHVDFRHNARDLEALADRMAVEAGYKPGDNIKYRITIPRKSP